LYVILSKYRKRMFTLGWSSNLLPYTTEKARVETRSRCPQWLQSDRSLKARAVDEAINKTTVSLVVVAGKALFSDLLIYRKLNAKTRSVDIIRCHRGSRKLPIYWWGHQPRVLTHSHSNARAHTQQPLTFNKYFVKQNFVTNPRCVIPVLLLYTIHPNIILPTCYITDVDRYGTPRPSRQIFTS